jgi:uncharacterized repeat protein (TIGR01451 family)
LLSISKSGPRYADPGDPITYVLTVVNRGINDATDVLVTDVIPQGATYVSGGSRQGNEVTWTIPTVLANGGSNQVSFVVTISTMRGLVNRTYEATCPTCIAAVGQVAVFTNDQLLYLPLIRK